MRRCLPLVVVLLVGFASGCGESIPRIEILEATDNLNGTMAIKYLAREFSGNSIDITAHFSYGEFVMQAATASGGEGTTELAASDGGTQHTFVWNYKTDLGIGRLTGVAFTIIPYGSDGKGRAGSIALYGFGMPKLFTVNQGADTVSIVDLAGGLVSSTVTVGEKPRGAVALPDESRLFVTNYDSNTVSVMDIGNPRVVSSVAVGTSPYGIAASPDGTRVYVVNSGDGTVSVINPLYAPPAVVDTYTVGTTPIGCALTENGETLFVTNSGDDTVSILLAADGTQLIAPIAAGSGPRGIATGPRYTVVCNYDSGTVSVIDNALIVTDPPQVAVDSQPVAAVVDAVGAFAYVANYDSDTISVVSLDGMAVVGTIELAGTGPIGGAGPRALALDSAGTSLYVAYADSSKLGKIDVETLGVLTQFSVGATPVAVVILSE
jgi:YVTN family beta-propeller protein